MGTASARSPHPAPAFWQRSVRTVMFVSIWCQLVLRTGLAVIERIAAPIHWHGSNGGPFRDPPINSSTFQKGSQPKERREVRIPVEYPHNSAVPLSDDLTGNANEGVHKRLALHA